MDTFVDSSWYFLRYCSPDYADGPFDPEAVRAWMPVAQYVGGVEHAILHLLYSRFFMKVLHDMGMVDAVEPFAALLNQGQVINQGKAMSKSLGNGVDLGQQLSQYGVDAVRLTVVFAGPPEDDIDWADVSPSGAVKYLARVARVAQDVGAMATTDERDAALDKAVARTVDDVTRVMEGQRLNVGVARLMELTTALRRAVDARQHRGGVAARRGHRARGDAGLLRAVHRRGGVVAPGPRRRVRRLGARRAVADRRPGAAGRGERHLRGAGRGQGARPARRARPTSPPDDLQALALASEAVQRSLDGRAVRTVVVRAPKLVNVVPA